MATSNPLMRAATYLTDSVLPRWQSIVCKFPPDFTPTHTIALLLAGIFFTLREAVESMGIGGNLFSITPYKLVEERPVKVLERELTGRARKVSIWVDSAVGLPDPMIRLGTSSATMTASGVRLTPGVANPIGVIPANTELYVASDVALLVFIVTES